MQVKIEEIQDKGLELNEVIPPDTLKDALLGSEGYKLKEAGRFHARLTRLSGRVLLSGDFTAKVVAPCKRCVKDVEVTLPIKFELALVPTRPAHRDGGDGDDDGKAPQAGSFHLGEADSEPFDGKTIQLDPIIREQVVLALPVSVLCKDDCRGLCTVCGQDLNDKECGCERKVVDIRLAKLKDIKLN